MQKIVLSTFKKYAFQGIAATGILFACCQTADATSSVFGAGWTEITNDDGVQDGGFVDPGWGGQDFDAEYLAYKLVGNTLSIGLQSGFDLISGKVYSGRNYYAGDLALSFDDDASIYEYAFDFGKLTRDYQLDKVDATESNSTGMDAYGLWAVTLWNNDMVPGFVGSSSPFAMDRGTKVSGANEGTPVLGVDYGYDAVRDTYWRIVSFDISAIGSNIKALDLHWTMSCGNDAISGHVANVPEPGLFLIFGTGLVGLIGLQHRKLRKE